MGDAVEWFQRFEICSHANEWNDAKKALKLPTLLEGEALAVWIELTDDEQKDYAVTKKKIIDVIMPMRFVSLTNFHKRMLMPGESLSMYVHQLKQLLGQAMPDISADVKEQLLLHQFLTGLPQEVSKQLRATGATSTLAGAVERAKLLMTIDHHGETAAITTKQPEFLQLQQQLTDLSEQVAALSLHQPIGFLKVMWEYEDVLYATKQVISRMHVPPNSQDKTHDDALHATTLVMDGETAHRETRKGRLCGAAAVPVTEPTSNHCGHSKEPGHSNQGRGGKCFS